MTKDEIIQMAEDCGIRHRYYEIPVSKKGIVTVESCTDRLLKFADLVAETEREACAKVVEADGLARGDEGLVLIKAAGRIRARGDKPPVKTYAGGKPNYCTPDVDAVDTSQEYVDETAKGKHDVPQP